MAKKSRRTTKNGNGITNQSWFMPLFLLLLGVLVVQIYVSTGSPLKVASPGIEPSDLPSDGYVILSESPQMNPWTGAVIQDIEEMAWYTGRDESEWSGSLLVARYDGYLGVMDVLSGDIYWEWDLNAGGAWFSTSDTHLQAIGYEPTQEVLYLVLDGARREIWRLPGNGLGSGWTQANLLEAWEAGSETEGPCGEDLPLYVNRLTTNGGGGVGGPMNWGSCQFALWGIDANYPDSFHGGSYFEEARVTWVCTGDIGDGPKYYAFQADAACMAAPDLMTDENCMNMPSCLVSGEKEIADLPQDYDPFDRRYSTKGWGGFNNVPMADDDDSYVSPKWILRVMSDDGPSFGSRAQTEGYIYAFDWDMNFDSAFEDNPSHHESGLSTVYTEILYPPLIWVSLDNGYLNPWGFDDAPDYVVDACKLDGEPTVAACDYVNPTGYPGDIESAYAGRTGSHQRLTFHTAWYGPFEFEAHPNDFPNDQWYMFPLHDIRPPQILNAGYWSCSDPDEFGGCNVAPVEHRCDYHWEEEGGCTDEGYFWTDYGNGWIYGFEAEGRIAPWLSMDEPGDCIVNVLDLETGDPWSYWSPVAPWGEFSENYYTAPSNYRSTDAGTGWVDVSGPACIAMVCNDELQNPMHYLEGTGTPQGPSWFWPHQDNVPAFDFVGSWESFLFDINGGCIEMFGWPDPPVLNPIPDYVVKVGENWQISATCEEQNELPVRFMNDADLFNIDPITGVMRYTPVDADIGIYDIQVMCEDSESETDTTSFRFIVTAATGIGGSSGPRAPSVPEIPLEEEEGPPLLSLVPGEDASFNIGDFLSNIWDSILNFLWTGELKFSSSGYQPRPRDCGGSCSTHSLNVDPRRV